MDNDGSQEGSQIQTYILIFFFLTLNRRRKFLFQYRLLHNQYNWSEFTAAVYWQMHMVFYNTIYCSFQEAASKSDVLAVVAVFLQVFYCHLFNSYSYSITEWAKKDSMNEFENERRTVSTWEYLSSKNMLKKKTAVYV